MIRTAMLAILTILLMGCQLAAVKTEPEKETLASKEAYWDLRAGSATYDDVVAQLGPPVYKKSQTDKSFTAEWSWYRYGVESPGDAMRVMGSEVLVMKFGPNGILITVSSHVSPHFSDGPPVGKPVDKPPRK